MHLVDSKWCSSDVMKKVKNRPLKKEKATYFLDKVINPALSGDDQPFKNLLQILKNTSNDIHIKSLVQDIEAGMCF